MPAEEPPRLTNQFGPEADSAALSRPDCSCLDVQYFGWGWEGQTLHSERQDTSIPAWKKLLQVTEAASKDGRKALSLGEELSPSEWAQIATLPASISRLKSLSKLTIYGSSLVRIPSEIGEMTNLETFEPYTSYRLHWFPYEITRCKKLKSSCVSTRALYGNFKYRPPFPKLPATAPAVIPETCSVCKERFASSSSVIQVWISLPVATDVLPLLVHACSQSCLAKLPAGATGWHTGGLDQQQPPAETWCTEKRLQKSLAKAIRLCSSGSLH